MGGLSVALRKESVDRNISVDVSYSIIVNVALRKESVDRNTNFRSASLFDLPSLSARRAWIEMISGLHPLMASVSRSPQGERG